MSRLWEYPTLVALETFCEEPKAADASPALDQAPEFRVFFGQVQSVDLLDDYLLVVCEKSVLLYDFMQPNKAIASLREEGVNYRCGRFAGDHVVISAGNQLWLCSLPDLKVIHQVSIKTRAITCLAVSPTSKSLLSIGCADGSIGLLRLKKLSLVKFLKECHAFAVSSLCFSLDEGLLISGSVGGTLLVQKVGRLQGSNVFGLVLLLLLTILVAYLARQWNEYE